MKKTLLTLTVTAFITGISLTGCNTPAQNVEDARENVTEANKDLAIANEEYLADIEKYKTETADKIAENDTTLAEFKVRTNQEKNEINTAYRLKIAELEQKNTDMKKKLSGYKGEGKEKWERFKAEFNSDMDELGNAFRDLTVKNVK